MSMKWWKKGLVISVVWTAFVVVGVLYQMRRIEKEAVSPAHRDAWETKSGKLTVEVFALGLAAIWAVLWSRRDREVGA